MMPQTNHEIGIRLSELLDGIIEISNGDDRQLSGISSDSRTIEPGDLFLALAGHKNSGIDFIAEAENRGAVAVVTDNSAVMPDSGAIRIPIVAIPEFRRHAGCIASRFFADPSREFPLIGITGTNGKTSVSTFIAAALSGLNPEPVGIVGTLGYGIFGRLSSPTHTTPEVVTLHRIMAQFQAGACQAAVMEVSSHALVQQRISGLALDIAVFTNLSRDHLDYHCSMDEYAGAKRRLFEHAGLKHAIVNADDRFGRQLIKMLPASLTTVSFGLRADAKETAGRDVIGTIRAVSANSLTLFIESPWGSGLLATRIGCHFNAYNLLAAFAVLCTLGVDFEQAIAALAQSNSVPGRMECFSTAGTATIFVDYAHTPDALKSALTALRQSSYGRIFCVFGCGGDRDKGKRSEMGAIAEQISDVVILTNDNPRSELPRAIIDDIEAGMTGVRDTVIELDRARAIEQAIQMAEDSDVVLVAGKGDETYQEIAGIRYPFNDRQLVRNLLGIES